MEWIEILKYVASFIGGGALLSLFNIGNNIKKSKIDNLEKIIEMQGKQIDANTNDNKSLRREVMIYTRAVNCSFTCKFPTTEQPCPVITYIQDKEAKLEEIESND